MRRDPSPRLLTALPQRRRRPHPRTGRSAAQPEPGAPGKRVQAQLFRDGWHALDLAAEVRAATWLGASSERQPVVDPLESMRGLVIAVCRELQRLDWLLARRRAAAEAPALPPTASGVRAAPATLSAPPMPVADWLPGQHFPPGPFRLSPLAARYATLGDVLRAHIELKRRDPLYGIAVSSPADRQRLVCLLRACPGDPLFQPPPEELLPVFDRYRVREAIGAADMAALADLWLRTVVARGPTRWRPAEAPRGLGPVALAAQLDRDARARAQKSTAALAPTPVARPSPMRTPSRSQPLSPPQETP